MAGCTCYMYGAYTIALDDSWKAGWPGFTSDGPRVTGVSDRRREFVCPAYVDVLAGNEIENSR